MIRTLKGEKKYIPTLLDKQIVFLVKERIIRALKIGEKIGNDWNIEKEKVIE